MEWNAKSQLHMYINMYRYVFCMCVWVLYYSANCISNWEPQSTMVLKLLNRVSVSSCEPSLGSTLKGKTQDQRGISDILIKSILFAAQNDKQLSLIETSFSKRRNCFTDSVQQNKISHFHSLCPLSPIKSFYRRFFSLPLFKLMFG